MVPVEALKFVITGAGEVVELIEMLSKVAASRAVADVELTANPKYAVDVIEIVWLPAIWVQLMPSGDTNPVNVFPARVIFVQYG